MHDAYGYAFFDYAAGAPYLKIDVKNPEQVKEMGINIRFDDED